MEVQKTQFLWEKYQPTDRISVTVAERMYRLTVD